MHKQYLRVVSSRFANARHPHTPHSVPALRNTFLKVLFCRLAAISTRLLPYWSFRFTGTVGSSLIESTSSAPCTTRPTYTCVLVSSAPHADWLVQIVTAVPLGAGGPWSVASISLPFLDTNFWLGADSSSSNTRSHTDAELSPDVGRYKRSADHMSGGPSRTNKSNHRNPWNRQAPPWQKTAHDATSQSLLFATEPLERFQTCPTDQLLY